MLVMIGAWIALQNAEQLAWSGVAKSIDTPFPVLAAGARPGVGVVEPAVRVRRGAGADRRHLRAHQPHQARQGDARHLPGPRDGRADGRRDRHHPHRHLRAGLRPRRGGRRAARARCSSSTRPWAISPRSRPSPSSSSAAWAASPAPPSAASSWPSWRSWAPATSPPATATRMGFLLIIVILLFKPTGLFAQKERIG